MEPEITAAPVEVKPEVQAEAPKVEATTEAAPALYELPDGRQVPGEELHKLYRDNLYPEFTRKSQELAALKAQLAPKEEAKPVAEAPWKDNPDWNPESYQQLSQLTAEQAATLAEQRVWEKLLAEDGRAKREQEERDAYIAKEVEQIKQIDPNVDVNRVMSFAAKNGFDSLVSAARNLKLLDDTEKRVEERVLKNIQARASSPVGIPSGSATAGIVFPPDVNTPAERARYALKQLSN